MKDKAPELESQVAQLLAEAEAVDTAEDAQYGQGRRGDELPEELRFRQRRLEKIRQAKAALEAEARAEAKSPGDVEAPPESLAEPTMPAEKTQKNFTDPDSRIIGDVDARPDSGLSVGEEGLNDREAGLLDELIIREVKRMPSR